MVGYVQEAIANALRNWEPLRAANVMPVRAVDGSSIVVNTTLPAIVIHINGTDGEGNTYFGGGIRQYFDLELWYIVGVPNYTFSPDGGFQAEQLDLSDEVIRCMEQTTELDDVRRKHDFNMQYARTETDTTYGTKDALSITVDVHKIIYACDVEFDPREDAFKRYAELKKVIIDNNGINESIIQ